MTTPETFFWMTWPALVVALYDSIKSLMEQRMRLDPMGTWRDDVRTLWRLFRNKPL
jgi:hypothetical protein